VTILPFNSNPFDIVQNARFTVLTSHYEGFPMSMVESLALGRRLLLLIVIQDQRSD
jgi:hypothetical protein